MRALELAERWPFEQQEAPNVFFPTSLQRQGGSVTYVVGDLRAAEVVPGRFDVVIERRTLQLFSDEERPVVMQRIADRLTEEGIFLSHCHDERWRPGRDPWHATEPWFEAKGWFQWSGDGEKPSGRVAWLVRSTG